ncbi:MAG TPA: LuxR C-terminal-related transcriptional regulator [Gaiellaceae bacterium]|nr:LuxR C-terminal-related transcriptional regulator [Gaiellaceae bacterium]
MTGTRLDAIYASGLPDALAALDVPAYVLDRQGRVRWLNDAAKEFGGEEIVGKLFSSVVSPDAIRRARQTFEKNLRGEKHGSYSIDLVPRGEPLTVEITSAPISRQHHVIGVFGIARPVENVQQAPRVDDRLTPRQHEILQLLAAGMSTDGIAKTLYLSRETVRNHIRHILQRLGVRSRLAAIALAHREGLV